MDILKQYVDEFNSLDEECYKNIIDNAHAYEFLRDEIPLFQCPDKDIERTYYFRWWTYRKHIKSTEDGYIISEFLPKVSWSGKHNSIVAPVGHHIYEGRWLKNGGRYLKDHIKFFLTCQPEHSHAYSVWLGYSVLKLLYTDGDIDFARSVLPLLCKYYEYWEDTHRLECGLFWSYDDRDAMEFTLSGTTPSLKMRKGIRPTLNSYMCADAYAISVIAELCGESQLSEKYRQKHSELRELINTYLLRDGFYYAYHYDEGEAPLDAIRPDNSAREQVGYIPYMFNIPEGSSLEAFKLLADENSFYCDYGITTAERSHPRFLYPVKHECLWNGYVWPFATSQTLNGLINAIDNYGGEEYRELFCRLLAQYAKSHVRTGEDGAMVPWIDEVRHPLVDDWSSRSILRDAGWQEEKGGYERGKDYNHSTFCDLVISGIMGVKTDSLSGELILKPNIPSDWDCCSLRGLCYMGRVYDITYTKSEGLKYTVR